MQTIFAETDIGYERVWKSNMGMIACRCDRGDAAIQDRGDTNVPGCGNCKAVKILQVRHRGDDAAFSKRSGGINLDPSWAHCSWLGREPI